MQGTDGSPQKLPCFILVGETKVNVTSLQKIYELRPEVTNHLDKGIVEQLQFQIHIENCITDTDTTISLTYLETG